MPLSFDKNVRATPNRTKGEETAARILDVTGLLLETQGYDALTTNRIAEAAGINIATLYRYYPNKQAILLAMNVRNRQSWSETLDRLGDPLRAGGDADWRSMIEQIIDFAVQRRNDQPGGKAMRLAMRLAPELQARDRQDSLEDAAFFSQLLIAKGNLDPRYALQVAAIAVEIGTNILDLLLVDQSPDDQVWIAEAKSAVCQYLAPFLEV
jgi:hypothetical protein